MTAEMKTLLSPLVVALCCMGCRSNQSLPLAAAPQPKIESDRPWTPPRPVNVDTPAPEHLLGAPSVQARDEIFEAVVRAVVLNAPREPRFIGIEYYDKTKEGSSYRVYLDPSSDLFARLRDLKVAVKPFSLVTMAPSEFAAGPGVCLLWPITMRSPEEAEVMARVGHYSSTSAVYCFRLVQSAGHWRINKRWDGPLIQ